METKELKELRKVKERKGDLVKLGKEGDFDVIVHGCNCFCTMGAGIARQIAIELPKAKQVDQETSFGDYNKMGNLSIAHIGELIVVNAYTQFEPGPNLDYEALILCLRKIKKMFPMSSIGIPAIGCGIGGGDWKKVKNIIEKELQYLDVTIIKYEKN